MKKMFLASLLMLTLSACSPSKESDSSSKGSEAAKDLSKKREYVFVETVEKREEGFKRSTYERTPIKIYATSDTAAMMIAYRNFCVTEALYLNNDYSNPNPKSFRIYDDTGADITATIMNLSKADQDKLEKRAKAIRANVFKEYDVKEPEY